MGHRETQIGLANHRQGAQVRVQRTGTHPAGCSGHSGTPGCPQPRRDLSRLHCQVSSRLDIAAASPPTKPRYSLSRAYLTSPSPVLDKPPTVDHPQGSGPENPRCQGRASPFLLTSTPLTRAPAEGVGPRLEPLKRALPPTSADLKSTIPNPQREPRQPRKPGKLYGCRVPASGRHDKVRLRLAAFQPLAGCVWPRK